MIAARAEQLDAVSRAGRRRARVASTRAVVVATVTTGAGAGEKRCRLAALDYLVLVFVHVLAVELRAGLRLRRRRRQADVQGLYRVRLGLAVGAIVLVTGAVGLDDVLLCKVLYSKKGMSTCECTNGNK